jgi:hypothetical protein
MVEPQALTCQSIDALLGSCSDDQLVHLIAHVVRAVNERFAPHSIAVVVPIWLSESKLSDDLGDVMTSHYGGARH